MTMFNQAVGVGFVDGVYWTLWVELRFYLLIAVLLFFNQIHRIEMWVTVWLGVSIMNVFLHSTVIDSLFFTSYSAYFIA